MIAAHRPAEAGQQNERPADELLPEISGGIVIPGRMDAEQIHQIPHTVVGNHIDHQKAPEGIQQVQAGLLFVARGNSL